MSEVDSALNYSYNCDFYTSDGDVVTGFDSDMENIKDLFFSRNTVLEIDEDVINNFRSLGINIMYLVKRSIYYINPFANNKFLSSPEKISELCVSEHFWDSMCTGQKILDLFPEFKKEAIDMGFPVVAQGVLYLAVLSVIEDFWYKYNQ